MKRSLLLAVALSLSFWTAQAQDSGEGGTLNLLTETFSNVSGSDDGTTPVDESQLDNPSGWIFSNVYAGKECLIIKKGGSITTPAIADLTGNAAFYFSTVPWQNPSINWDELTDEEREELEENLHNPKPHPLSIAGGGELSISEYDGMVAMSSPMLYGVGPLTRITLTASCDITISGVGIYYGSFQGWGDLTKFSHESGEYFQPFDLMLTQSNRRVDGDDGTHNILVYTLDGSEPKRTSPRYGGTPIRIDHTTTVRTATILGNGAMQFDTPRNYTFRDGTVEFPDAPAATYDVAVNQPGGLRAAMAAIDADLIEGVRVTGKLNSEDLKYLNSAEGRFNLKYINLAEATIEYDGQAYSSVTFAPPGGMGHTTFYTYVLTEEEYKTYTGNRPDATYYELGSGKTLAALFHNNSKIEHIVFPKCIEKVGSYFGGGSGIKAVELHDGVTEICDNAFSNSRFYNIPLTAINIPKGIRRIGNSAFGMVNELCAGFDLSEAEEIGTYAFSGTLITGVTFGDKLHCIGAGAFSGTKLGSIELPDQLEVIEESTFEGCELLSDVKLPANLKYVGGRAFTGTPWLAAIEPENGIRYVLNTPMEVADPTLNEYTLRQGSKSVPAYLFSGLENLKTVSLPEGLEEIGREAFKSSSLESISLPSSLRLIDEEAFMGTRLSRMTIPENVDSIGVRAFYCDKLWNLTFNAIHARCAFQEGWSSFPNGGQLERVALGYKVEYIPYGIFSGNQLLTSVELPASVREIGDYAYRDCPKLITINLNDNITTIGDWAFANCSSLADIRWPLNLRSVGESAFFKCSALTMISLPEGTKNVGDRAFDNCDSVGTIYVPSTIEKFGEAPFNLWGEDVNVDITFMSATPLFSDWYKFGMSEGQKVTTIKVPAGSVETYKALWPLVADRIIPLGEISAAAEDSTTDFGGTISDDTDLSDAFVGETYVTLGEEDSYDSSDGSIVLGSTMSDEEAAAVGGLEPGKSDIANRFNGIVVMIGPGNGSVVVNCQTFGANKVAVKIGEQEPEIFNVSNKGDITVDYNVSEATCVYIYGSATEPSARSLRKSRAAVQSDNYIKLYSVSVKIENSGISDIISDSKAEITDWYNLNGQRIIRPTVPGIYIIRRADGTTAKIAL